MLSYWAAGLLRVCCLGWGINLMLLFVSAVFLVAAAVSTMPSVSLLLLTAGLSSILLEVIL